MRRDPVENHLDEVRRLFKSGTYFVIAGILNDAWSYSTFDGGVQFKRTSFCQFVCLSKHGSLVLGL